MILCRYPLEEWKKIAFNAHLACFGEERDADTNTYDYVLCSFKDDPEKTICGYIGILEQDKHSAYLQHGGAFPTMEGTALTMRSYKMAVNYLKERYNILFCTILNTNISMLKMALNVGFKIIGVDYDQQKNAVVLRLANYIYKEQVS